MTAKYRVKEGVKIGSSQKAGLVRPGRHLAGPLRVVLVVEVKDVS
jgi:hypothetical protein